MTEQATELEELIDRIPAAKAWEKPGLYYSASVMMAKMLKSYQDHKEVVVIALSMSSLKDNLAVLCELKEDSGQTPAELLASCFEDISSLKEHISQAK